MTSFPVRIDPSSNHELIALDRRFVRVTDGVRGDHIAGHFRRMPPPVTWTTLLETPCAVVLGERGIGKTAELRKRVEDMAQAGGFAFFLLVEILSSQGPVTALARDNSFRRWKDASEGEAWFMLDAVDESILKGRALSLALNSFCHELGAQLSRVRMVVSSRASDWRSADEEELRSLAKQFAAPIGDGKHLELFQLAPLSETQVAALCAHWGLNDVDAFLEAVHERHAWSFLERPLDVRWLARYWDERKRLGSLHELIEFNIDERLKEKPERPTSISLARARDGASTLCLVAVLSGTSAFSTPTEDVDSRATDAFRPTEVLAEWRNEEVQDLLARGLFDEATYGRVRVHHRSVLEYLSAERLARMLKDGFPRRELNSIFFRQIAGRTVVPRHLTAVLAWLALRDSDIRKLAIQHAPEQLIDQGDPSSLPADDRRKALRAYVERFGQRERVFHDFDLIGLERFASSELSETIREMLGEPDEPDHIRELLLRMVAAGGLTGLADVALGIGLDLGTTAFVRVAAIRAVAEAGRPGIARNLSKLVGTAAAEDQDVVAVLLDDLTPDVLEVVEVVELLRGVRRSGRRSVTRLDLVAEQLPERYDAESRRGLLAGLLPMLRTDGAWVSRCVTELVRLIANADAELPPEIHDAVEWLYGADEEDARPGRDLAAILEKHPALRRVLFWSLVEKRRMTKAVKTCWDAMSAGARLTLRDLHWLCEDARTMSHPRDRALAFDCAWQVAKDAPVERLMTLRDVATQSDSLRGSSALARKLTRKLNPPSYTPPDFVVHAERGRRARERHASRLVQKNRQELLKYSSQIAAGQHLWGLVHLYDRFPESWTLSNIEGLYGPEVAQAAMHGVKAFWKIHPAPRVEEYEPSRFPYAGPIGVVGVDQDVQAGLDVASLSWDLQRAAVGYSVWKLNKFPEWVEAIAQINPELVRDTLAPAIEHDYTMPEHGRVIPKLDSAPTAIRSVCYPVLWRLLSEVDPSNLQHLTCILEAFEGLDEASPTELTSLAEARARLAISQPPRFAIWWCEWFAHDAMFALDGFEAMLAAHTAPFDLAEGAFSRLWRLTEPRHGGTRGALATNREAIVRLIPLVHQYIRPADDIHHDGAFTVGRRDDCQDLRNSLINWLSAIEGTATVEALERFAGDPALSKSSEWLLHLADQRAIDDATTQTLTVRQAAALVHTLVLQPANAAELFRIALNRLDDIRLYLSEDDFSVKQAYNPPESSLEEPVQNLLAHELDVRRRDQYSVVREPEVSDKNEPDIRLVNANCEGPVTIEVKIAERWSGRALEEALSEQLVNKYMRDGTSRFGILVVCSSGKPNRTWEVGSGETVDFTGLVSYLTNCARSLAANDPRVEELRVFALDLH